ncbi:hypothetical protein B7Z17_01525 [Candidatus Saccharibacteria bacterium 32-49-10]|nr:MAG: hypothetical protein B7Z17_01525 [Candidatus Saccharibacteria bacterium 32-49-10]
MSIRKHAKKITTRLKSEMSVSLTSRKTEDGRAAAQERRGELRGLGRIAAELVHAAVNLHPEFFTRLQSKPYDDLQLKFIGAGWHADVVKQDEGESVLKVDRHSRLMTVDEQAAHVESLQAKDDFTVRRLANFALKTSYEVGPDPLDQRQTAVIGVQEYVPHRPVEAADNIDLESLRGFVAASRIMYNQTGVLPDLAMPGNVAVTDSGQVVLLDTEPIENNGTNDKDYRRNILASLRMLDRMDQILADATDDDSFEQVA